MSVARLRTRGFLRGGWSDRAPFGGDIGLAFLVFAVAAWTIFARGAFAATVGYVVYGLLLSLVWIRLFAVDVALTEAAIGSGVTGILLIGAAARLRGAETAGDGLRERPAAGLALLMVALALAAAGYASR
jgi:uncharacterized MnhB-related membrane protein